MLNIFKHTLSSHLLFSLKSTLLLFFNLLLQFKLAAFSVDVGLIFHLSFGWDLLCLDPKSHSFSLVLLSTLASSFLRKSAWKYIFWVFLWYRNVSVIPWTNSGGWWGKEFKFGNNFLSTFERRNSAVSWHAMLEVWCHSYSWTFENFIQLLVLQWGTMRSLGVDSLPLSDLFQSWGHIPFCPGKFPFMIYLIIP